MHLQQELRLQSFGAHARVHAHHGGLDDVRRRALNGHIERHALAKAAEVEIRRFQLRQVAPAAEKRRDIAVGLGLCDDAVHIGAHAVVLGKIAVHVRLGLALEHADVLREAEGRDAINNAEIDGFGVRALQRRDLVERHAEHLRRRDGVDVLPAAEGRDHGLIIGDVREQAQLDLAVVRVHEHLAGRGHEHIADLRAELAAHGDILQVRFRGRQAPRRRNGHLEVRVDAPVGRDLLEQPIGIGGF